MHSFTSSSDERLSQTKVIRPFIVGIMVGCMILGMIELRLRQIGFRPSVQDSKELWATERSRASLLGKQALILVGDSRMQLDMDLDALAETTGLTPIQLAIDGSEFLPVLADIAQDKSITGTVMVSGDVCKLVVNPGRTKAEEWIEFYHREYRDLIAPKLETKLKSRIHQMFALYASGFPPTHLIVRLTSRGKILPFYLTTRANRERNADYQLVPQPDFYIEMVLRTQSKPLEPNEMQSYVAFEQAVLNKLQLSKRTYYTKDQFSYVNTLTEQIIKRGGKVAFVSFPISGLVRSIDKYRYPKQYGWDVFASHTKATTVHFDDYQQLHYTAPDGSHLDFRDKKTFTKQLVNVLALKKFWLKI